jgi:hypothetical protein
MCRRRSAANIHLEMSKQAFDREVAGLEALRSASDPQATREQLGKALTDCNDYLVSSRFDHGRVEVSRADPRSAHAFDRFFVDPVKADPQCMAKNAIVQALKKLGIAPRMLMRVGSVTCSRAAIGFTGLTRAQLTVAERNYSSAADLMRVGDNDPTSVSGHGFHFVSLARCITSRGAGDASPLSTILQSACAAQVVHPLRVMQCLIHTRERPCCDSFKVIGASPLAHSGRH